MDESADDRVETEIKFLDEDDGEVDGDDNGGDDGDDGDAK